MIIEPGYDGSGERVAWLLYWLDRYAGSVTKTKRGCWQLNCPEGGISGVYKTRREAFEDARRRLTIVSPGS
jgi:hypothetical protein